MQAALLPLLDGCAASATMIPNALVNNGSVPWLKSPFILRVVTIYTGRTGWRTGVDSFGRQSGTLHANPSDELRPATERGNFGPDQSRKRGGAVRNLRGVAAGAGVQAGIARVGFATAQMAGKGLRHGMLVLGLASSIRCARRPCTPPECADSCHAALRARVPVHQHS